MQNAPEAIAAMQAQALDAIRTGQTATLEAVKNWNEAVAKFAPTPGSTFTPVPGAPDIPAPLKDAMGDPSAIVDLVYDFARQLLELNKQFVHQLLEVSRPK